ncbi:sulfatase-like hydrolase/transferase, partial [Moorena sp. SIO4A5]|uniref:sulfatase-like hydrolase/transferase n=1 Tax=Moorena sp. SIO4A5 TaxID=2607838 RepID=UPI0013CABB37
MGLDSHDPIEQTPQLPHRLEDKLGCYGFDRETSPEIDAIAAAGMRFDRVVAQASWTRPSIGSLLTSRYPRSLGLY